MEDDQKQRAAAFSVRLWGSRRQSALNLLNPPHSKPSSPSNPSFSRSWMRPGFPCLTSLLPAPRQRLARVKI